MNSLDHPLEAGCSIAPTHLSLYISKWDVKKNLHVAYFFLQMVSITVLIVLMLVFYWLFNALNFFLAVMMDSRALILIGGAETEQAKHLSLHTLYIDGQDI